MKRKGSIFLHGIGILLCLAAPGTSLPAQPARMGGALWKHQEALGQEQLDGIRRYLDRRLEEVVAQRASRWRRVLTSPDAYAASVEANRARLRRLIGLVDQREAAAMEYFGTDANPALVAETDRYTVHQVRWPVFASIQGEGLLLTPKAGARARVVALPDADQTPEQIVGLAPGVAPESQFARRLAESGLQVVVPVLIDRDHTFSGSDRLVPNRAWRDAAWDSRWTNIPHCEWAFRQGYLMGRHVIGYEVQKVLAVVDWLEVQDASLPVGVAGYGEGGLLAFYAASVDLRIDAAMVSGHFGPREGMGAEPIYRSIWGFLTEFGDAEVASLIMPRPLVIEYSPVPSVAEPPESDRWKGLAASPGSLTTPTVEAVRAEVDRLRGFFRGGDVAPDVTLVENGESPVPFGSEPALKSFLARLNSFHTAETGRMQREREAGGLNSAVVSSAHSTGSGHPERSRTGAVQKEAPTDRRRALDLRARQKRQIDAIVAHTRDLVGVADRERHAFIKGDYASPAAWDASMKRYREIFWDELIGRLPEPSLPPNVKLRRIFDEPTWTGYEVIMDVWPEMFTFGVLGVPKNLREGERRPTVVLQHGHGGLGLTPIAAKSYHCVMIDLTERGFVTYAPHNSYQFWVQEALPLKASRFSVILAQHQQILRWLGLLPYVDAARIGFYGKSWGGKSALHLPSLLDGYALSICSGFFNDWARKVTTTEFHASAMFHDSIGIWQIATPDHLHTTHLEAAAKAGKHIYVEKPLATEMDKLVRAFDAVKEAGTVVQVGTQTRSHPGIVGAREVMRSGLLGKISRVEESRNSAKPYWYKYLGRGVKREDVDWREFLGDRPMRPFDADQYGAWYGYYDFCQGPVPQWGSHFLDTIHLVMDTPGFPESCVCTGGIFTWKDEHNFTTPDCVQATWIYPEGYLLTSANNFGNSSGNVRKLYGTKGTLDLWNWLAPSYSAEGGPMRDGGIRGKVEVDLVERPAHMLDWLQCIRTGGTPHAPIEAGYQHAVAALMAVIAYETGKKTTYDHRSRRILTA